MNKIILMGRLTKDPEVRYTQSGKVVCQFTIAVDRPFSGEDGKKEADFIPIIIWGKPAEIAGNSLAKGHRVLVEGRLQIRSYDDNKGVKRWISEVIANSFEFIERKADGATSPASPAPTNNNPSPMDSFGTPLPYNQEEIPF
ncbi:MAG: single-stranded DNA-binding protein [Phascolarctobacterium sp.]|nr:single-stranded DNA-binding protein [Phascolarctobacterium sp.]